MMEDIQVEIGSIKAYEDAFIWETEFRKALFEKCQTLFQTYFGTTTYPKKQVEKSLERLFDSVEVRKEIRFRALTASFDWTSFLKALQENFPQFVWTGVVYAKQTSEWVFQFVPLIVKTKNFPFEINLPKALVQQKMTSAAAPIAEWRKLLIGLAAEFDERLTGKPVEATSLVDSPKVEQEPISDTQTKLDSAKPESQKKTIIEKRRRLKQEFATAEYDSLKGRVKELEGLNQQLEEELERVQTESLHYLKEMTEKTAGLEQNEVEKQARYYEEALRRERNAKERMRLSKEKLEHLVSRLERQVMTTGLTILEKDFPYLHRAKDWHRKIVIPLPEYDHLYQKAKFLEHTWHVNQQLELTNEKMIVSEAELLYERERLKKIKNSAKDIELFVMMDECRLIHERAKIKPGFLWLRPRVVLLKEDYENLVEKAAYYDVIQSENQLLERLIEERKGYRERKVVK